MQNFGGVKKVHYGLCENGESATIIPRLLVGCEMIDSQQGAYTVIFREL